MVKIIPVSLYKRMAHRFSKTCKVRYLNIVIFSILILLLTSTIPLIQLLSLPQSGSFSPKTIVSSTSLSSETSFESTQPYDELGSRGEGSANRNNNASLFDPKTQYLIITPEEFIPELEPLSAWKHQKGVYTDIATIDGLAGINSTYSGPDLAAKIHTFLRDYYASAPDLQWLLLIGDSEIIPARLLLNKNVSGDFPWVLHNYCYSDYYYSALDTTWDNNSNQIYGETGEEDWESDLYTGRLPVNNITEVRNAVNKILVYEKNPPYGGWFNKTIQCGALMDRPNVLDDFGTPVDEGYDWYKDNARKVIMKVKKHLPNDTQNFTFLDYDKVYGGDYKRENDNLNETLVVAAFNSGASTVNFVAKGDDNGVRHYSGNGVSKIEFASAHFFNHQTINKLENEFKLPLIYTSSCSSLNFTEPDDSNLENLITSAQNGAIGIIGGSTETYRLEFYEKNSSYGNWWLNDEFWRRFFTGEGEYKPGEILYNLKSDYYLHFLNSSNPYPDKEYQPLYRTDMFAYNLLGDPEVSIYTQIPNKLNVQHPNTLSPILRNHSLTIKVFDDRTNQPVYGAKVCLMGNDIYEVIKTDANGIATFNLIIQKEEILNLTVTAHNHYYYEGNIEVHAHHDLVVKPEYIKFDRNPVPPGENISISINVLNNGSTVLSDILINCYSEQISNENLLAPTLKIESLSARKKKNVTFNWTTPDAEFWSTESRKIIAVVDVNDNIFELNEDNNAAETTLFKNIPPEIYSIPDLPMFEDTPVHNIIDLKTGTYDEDTSELQYFIDQVSNPEFIITLNGSKLSANPPTNWYGNVSVVASVFDGTSYDTDEFVITVHPMNDPPVLNETLDWLIQCENVTVTPGHISVLEDQVVKITVVGNDYLDNNTNLKYSADTNLFVINESTGEFSFVPDNSLVGEYQINFSVSDGFDNQSIAWRWVTLEVLNTNDPPELDPLGVYYITVGEMFELKIEGTDVDQNDTLTYRDDTELFNIDLKTGEISFKPKDSDVGTHKIKIIVSDGSERTSKTLTLEIESAPDDPLNPSYLLLCPIILIILIIFLFVLEYRKTHSKKDEAENKTDKEPKLQKKYKEDKNGSRSTKKDRADK